MNKGTLYLVATPIGNLNEMTPRAISVLSYVDLIACEDTRTSSVLLKHFSINTKTISYHNFNEDSCSDKLIELLTAGKNIAIISDAGYPLISDPGYIIVNRAIRENIEIVPVSGANAAINALIVSGLPINHYLFYGFLSSKTNEAKKELNNLVDFPYTMIFYEAPHRIKRTLTLILEIFGDRYACIAREISKKFEEKIRGKISFLNSRDNYKGELVLVVEGNNKKAVKEEDMESALQMIKKDIAKGISLKVACKLESERSIFSKNDLYDAYLNKDIID